MQNLITVAAILAMIAVGVVLINRLNGQHGRRIAAHHWDRMLPGHHARRSHPASDRGQRAGGRQ